MKTFVLLNKKTYRRAVKIFIESIKNGVSALVPKYVTFSTEHLITAKERSRNARTVGAEYRTGIEAEIEALMTSDAYGKIYTLKGDIGGKLKKERSKTYNPEDLKKAGLRSLFEDAGMKFDESKSLNELSIEYAEKYSAGGDVKTASPPKPIPMEKVNVSQVFEEAKNQARHKYVEKYGKNVPESVANDLAFLDGMADPDFDAEAYIEGVGGNETQTLEELQAAYKIKFSKMPPNTYKNDHNWLKNKLAEE